LGHLLTLSLKAFATENPSIQQLSTVEEADEFTPELLNLTLTWPHPESSAPP